MSKMKDIAKEVVATFTVAALTVAVATTTRSVYADGNNGERCWSSWSRSAVVVLPRLILVQKQI